ncbi:SGNH/GDSL hydrolase family protein [Morganella morganii]|nr:SGNH/GDSL hydrolase family protein [Morganella morganii]
MKRIIFIIVITFFPIITNAKTLFFGDSLTYVIGNEYKRKIHDTDIIYNVGFSFRVNHEFMFNSIDTIDLKQYDNLYIVFGTNDFINQSDIDNYSILTVLFISRVLNNNKDINIVWILPPTLKNETNNTLVGNTRKSIMKSLNTIGVSYFDINSIFGIEYQSFIGDKKIRTNDGVHITNYGARLIVDYLIKG